MTEYQLHRLRCARCGVVTCGQLPAGVPAHGYGPRVASVIALCSGAYRLSKRKVASFCREVLGIPVAAGAVCNLNFARNMAYRHPQKRGLRSRISPETPGIDKDRPAP